MGITNSDQLFKAKQKLQGLIENKEILSDPVYAAQAERLQSAIAEYEGGPDTLGLSAEDQDLIARGGAVVDEGAPAVPAQPDAISAMEQRLPGVGAPRMGDIVAQKARSLGIDDGRDPGLRALTGQYTFPEDATGAAQLAPSDSASGRPDLYRPSKGTVSGADSVLWEEPPLERAREILRPYLGDAADSLAETDPEYQALADFEYRRAFDEAEKAGRGIIRPKYVGTTGTANEGLANSALGVLGGGLNDVRAAFRGAHDMASFGLGHNLSDLYKRGVKENGLWRALPLLGGPAMLMAPWALPGETQVGGGGTEEEASPLASAAGSVVGMVSPGGASNLLAQLGTGLAKKMAGGAAAGLAKRTAAGALGGALAGALDASGWQAGNLLNGKPASMEDWAAQAALGVLGGGILGGLTEPLSAAAGLAARGLRSKNPAFGGMATAAEEAGHELGPLGGARMSPEFQELQANAKSGLSPFDEATRRAMARIPDERELYRTIQQSGNIPIPEEAFAQDIAPVLATAARQHQGDALDAIRNAERQHLADAGEFRADIKEIANQLWDTTLQRGRNKLPMVELGELPKATARSYQFTVTDDAQKASRMANIRGGRAINSRDMMRYMPEVMKEAIDAETLVISQALERDFASGRAWVVGAPRRLSLPEFEQQLMPAIERKAKAAATDPNVEEEFRRLLRTAYDQRDKYPGTSTPEFSDVYKNLVGEDPGLPLYVAAPDDAPVSPTAMTKLAPEAAQTAVRRKSGYGAFKRRASEVISKAESRNYKAGLPKDLDFPSSVHAPEDEAARLAMREVVPEMTPEQEERLLNVVRGFRSNIDIDEWIPMDRRGGKDAATWALLQKSPLRGTPGDSPAFEEMRKGARDSLMALSSKNQLKERGGVEAVLARLGTPQERPGDFDTLWDAATRVTKQSMTEGQTTNATNFITAVKFIKSMNSLGGSREAALSKLQNIPRTEILGMEPQMRALFGDNTWRSVKAAWAGEKFIEQTRHPGIRMALNKVPILSTLLGTKLPSPQVGAFNTVPVEVVPRMLYPTLRALGSAPGEFPKPGPRQAERFGRSLALKGEPSRLPAWLDAYRIGSEKKQGRGERTRGGKVATKQAAKR